MNQRALSVPTITAPRVDAASPSAQLRGWWLSITRAAWYLTAACVALILLASLPLSIAQLGTTSPLERWRDGVVGVPLSQRDGLEYTLDLITLMVGLVSTAAYLALAFLLFRRKGTEPMALLLSLFLLLFGVLITEPVQTLTAERADWFRAGYVSTVIIFQAFWFLFFLFPNGRFVPRWTRWLLLAFALWSVATVAFNDVVLPSSQPTLTHMILLFIWHLGFPLAGVTAQIHRYRHVSTVVERQQTKWVVFGFGAMFFVFLVLPLIFVFPILSNSTENANVTLFGMRLFNLVYAAFIILVPLTMVIAILRYHLFDIDLIISRSLVYGALTAIVVGVYVLSVGLLGGLFHTSGNLVISLLATGLIAILFQPLREHLQRAVNRLIYGERDDPYAVLSQLGQRLEATLASEAVLPTIVETVAQALKVPYVAIEIGSDERRVLSAEYPPHSELSTQHSELFTLPLTYQHEPLGELVVARRTGEDQFSNADMRLLETLAAQASVAVRAVHLATDLQSSRERLVSAREEERRRIRRDLHDGLGPSLASLTLKLDAARNLLAHDPSATDRLLSELKMQTKEAIADIRRLVYDLRPPALDDLGLLSALREQITLRFGGNGLVVSLEAPDALPPLPAAVEVAAYRIALEALTNVTRHAHAQHVTIHLTLDDALQLEVRDDGVGLPSDMRAGVGYTSMRERAAELGGTCVMETMPSDGTRVVARLPITTVGGTRQITEDQLASAVSRHASAM